MEAHQLSKTRVVKLFLLKSVISQSDVMIKAFDTKVRHPSPLKYKIIDKLENVLCAK